MLNFWISLIPVTEYWPAKPYFAVPLVTIFTKFDGQIIAEYVKLNVIENTEDRWEKARENAEISFQTVYLPKVLNTEHPPKAYVQLQGEPENGDHFLAQLRKYSPMIDLDIPENNCPELTERQVMQLMTVFSKHCLSQHKGTTLIFLLNLHFSENHVETAKSCFDMLQICFYWGSSKAWMAWSYCCNSLQVSTFLGKFEVTLGWAWKSWVKRV